MVERPVTLDDLRFMDAALAHAYQALGSTAPNPAVGCVLVKDGRILAAASTAAGGRPHAEAQALEIAGEAANGATAYVTLEPCAHYGATPPCADALVKAGVAEVVVACLDPFEKVDGRGIEILKSAGAGVVTQVRREEAERLNAGFFSLVRTGQPIAERDPRPALYDQDLAASPDALDAALEAAGAAGITRVRLI